MSQFKKLLGVVAVATWYAEGHEIETHISIGDVAVDYLAQQSLIAGRPTLPGLRVELHEGAIHEDIDPIPGVSCPDWLRNLNGCRILGRFFFHFNPRLKFSGPPFDGFPRGRTSSEGSCDSTQWGFEELPCFGRFSVGNDALVLAASQQNPNRWSQSLESDSSGRPSDQSIRRFSYDVHLLEDLGSPAHTRNDYHPCVARSYCDPFEAFNNAARSTDRGRPSLATALALPTGRDAIIPTTEFRRPEEFFTSLSTFVREHYYSNRTVYATSLDGLDGVAPGPCSAPVSPLECNLDGHPALDSHYLYGPCVISASGFNLSKEAGNCLEIESGNQHLWVRKIARKTHKYVRSCLNPATGCRNSLADIDEGIAREQFAELGPLLVQHVAAFIQYYAPALTVEVQGSGVVRSSLGTGINCGSGSCSAPFVQGTPVTLTASPSTVTWAGDCVSAGTNATATVTLTSDKHCKAIFDLATAHVSGKLDRLLKVCKRPDFSEDSCIVAQPNWSVSFWLDNGDGVLDFGDKDLAIEVVTDSNATFSVDLMPGSYWIWTGGCDGSTCNLSPSLLTLGPGQLVSGVRYLTGGG